jgi:sodium/potassium/calcium exchanger 6
MGLTLMAWGNSLQDLAGNTSLALNGLPSMALTACIASE